MKIKTITKKKLLKRKDNNCKILKELISNIISQTNTKWFIKISMNKLKVKEEVEVVVEILEVAVEEDEVVANMTLKKIRKMMRKLHKKRTTKMKNLSQKWEI